MKIAIIGGGPAGLYCGLLMKKADPRHEIVIIERNPPDVTYGWGVVFSDRTLASFQRADYKTYEAITEQFVIWDAIDVWYRDELIRAGGHVLASISRKLLLTILHRRCAELGVALHFDTEVDDLTTLASYDLIVGADGINSLVRKTYASAFAPSLELGRAKYIWFGTDKVLDCFTFIFRENEHGLFQVHAYPFSGTTSTFIVECDEAVWRRAGLDIANEAESITYCERLFAPDLHGCSLLSNNSKWISFATLKNQTWHQQNVVLLGDAAHTAHFSIGSGTKLAMEDAIALANAFEQHQDIATALGAYELERKPVLDTFQEAARQSQRYFERTHFYQHLAPMQFAFHLLTRSGRISYDDLRLRDARFGDSVDRWFAQEARREPSSRGRMLGDPGPQGRALGDPGPQGPGHERGQELAPTHGEGVSLPDPFGRRASVAGTPLPQRPPPDASLPLSTSVEREQGVMLGPSDGPLPPPRQKGSGSGVERVTTIVAPPPLFAPLALSGLVVANRVVVAPLSPGRAQDGLPDEAYLAQLGTAARGGAGLVMTAPVAVSREGRITPGCAGMYRAEHVAAWARIVDAVHACAPAKIAIELNHAGRRGATRPRSQGLDRPLRVGGWPLVSASPLPYTPQSPVPQELDRAGMDRVRDDFVHATQMACEAGFDILQLHFAHGYLLASFISPLTNVRNDAYGNETDSSSLMNVPFSTRISTVGPSGPAQYSGPLGPRSEYQPAANVRPDDAPLANRMRFPLEVFDAVRAEWPADRPIMVAITASDCVPGRSWERAERERSGGRGMPRDVADAVAVARLLAAHGCDLITVLAGQTTPDAEPPYGRGFLIPLSDQIRNEAGVATLAGGYITTTNEVNTALAAGHADLCLIEGP